MQLCRIIFTCLIISPCYISCAASTPSSALRAYEQFLEQNRLYQKNHGIWLEPPFYTKIAQRMKNNIIKNTGTKITKESASELIASLSKKDPSEIIAMYDNATEGLQLFLKKNGKIKKVVITRRLGRGTNKVAYNIKGSNKALIIPALNSEHLPEIKKSMDQEISWSNYITDKGLLGSQATKVELSIDKKHWFPAYTANSFEALGSEKGIYVIDPKGNRWNPHHKNCLFSSIDDAYHVAAWKPPDRRPHTRCCQTCLLCNSWWRFNECCISTEKRW